MGCSHSCYLHVCSLSFFFLPHTAASSLGLSSWSPPHGPRRPCLGPPELSLLKDKQVQVPQPLLCRAHAPNPTWMGLPWIFTTWSMSFLYQGLKLDTGLQVSSKDCWKKGNHHTPWCTGHAALDPAPCAVGLVDCTGTQQGHSRDHLPPEHPQLLPLQRVSKVLVALFFTQ